MKTSKFTDEQIALALRQAEAGTPVGEICRKLGRYRQCSTLLSALAQ
jgi:putative transposase